MTTLDTTASGVTLAHDTTEYVACNMRYVVLAADGHEMYRGPEWAARLRFDRLAERAS